MAHDSNKNGKKKGNPTVMAAGAAGAVAGAALGAAAATVLSNKQTRKKVVQKINQLRKQAISAFRNATQNPEMTGKRIIRVKDKIAPKIQKNKGKALKTKNN